MDLKEFNSLINSSISKEKEERLKRDRNLMIAKQYKEAKEEYEEVCVDKRALDIYSKFIDAMLPNVIKNCIYCYRNALVNDSNPRLYFSLEIIGSRTCKNEEFMSNKKGHNVITLNEQYFQKFVNFVEQFFEKYGILVERFPYLSNNVVHVIHVNLVDLFYSYVLEKEHGISYLKENINTLLEDYDDSLKIQSNDKIKVKSKKE